jgi:ribosomal protein S18 acetylase RimI-like enzyme
VEITVRDAELADVPAVLVLMAELAEHEGLRQYLTLTPESLAQFSLIEPKRFHVLVAIADTAVVGYATYLFPFSPWMAREYLFVDDLYVASSHRGEGAGAMLMDRVAAIAVERDVDARWHIELENRRAQDFYTALGAELRDRFTAYWSRDAMRARLAQR